MGSLDRTLDGNYLEAQLLADPVSYQEDDDCGDGGRIIYRASFEELEENYVTRPIFLPCFGVMRREKHVLLPLVTDVVIEQGCLQSAFGIFSIRIENAGLKRPPPVDDIKIEGVVNPRLFRKVVLMAVSSLRKERLANKNTGLRGPANEEEELPTFRSEVCHPPQSWAWQHGGTGLTSWQMSPVDTLESNSFQSISGDILLQKLEEVGNSVKRVEILIGNQQCQKSEDTT